MGHLLSLILFSVLPISQIQDREIQDREIRIDDSGAVSDQEIKLVRKVGEFGSQEATATCNLPTQAAPEAPAAIEPAVEVNIDRSISTRWSVATRERFKAGMSSMKRSTMVATTTPG